MKIIMACCVVPIASVLVLAFTKYEPYDSALVHALLAETNHQQYEHNVFSVTSINAHGLMPTIALDEPQERLSDIGRLIAQHAHGVGTIQEDWCKFDGVLDTAIAKSGIHIFRTNTSAPTLLNRIFSYKQLKFAGLHCTPNSASGLTLVGSEPITQLTTKLFDACEGIDCFVHKGILCAWWEHENLRLCTTHLQAGKHNTAHRIDQLDAIDALLTAFGDDRLILTGDFNICSDELTDSQRPDETRFRRFVWTHRLSEAFDFHSPEGKCRKDFVLFKGVRRNAAYIVSDRVSDHPLLQVHFFR